MNPILIKLFATALTLSQVTTRPDAVRTQFDPAKDSAEVVQVLRDGCAHMRKAFDIEDINLDDLISTAMDDPKAVAGDTKIFQGLDFKDLFASYRQFCKNETVKDSPFEAGPVIEFYNKAAADLPDARALKEKKLPGATTILDGKGSRYSEAFEPHGRRTPVAIGDVPPLVRQAFIAAEDKRFEAHRGIDERGVIRAFIANLAAPGRPAGGSTITQQVVKNLLVGDDVTYERKIREMIVAARLERVMTKPEILETYLNAIYLGRGAYGVEMAAQSWFGKSIKDVDLPEAALLAGLPKGPNFYSPDRNPERARERRAYVLSRLKEDGTITAEQAQAALAAPIRLAPPERARRDQGLHLVDLLNREARMAGVESLTAGAYTVRSTINAGLQLATETALQEGLARYEMGSGRQRFEAPELNLAEAVRKLEPAKADAGVEPRAGDPVPGVGGPAKASPAKAAAERVTSDKPGAEKPAWRRALESVRAPLYDVHWPLAVVLERGAKGVKVGLGDGRIVPLNAWPQARLRLQTYDVVHVHLRPGKAAAADLRARPSVQGAAVVLENRTGRILALSGGFSYPASQLNRVTQAARQPGSTFKPFTYLAALSAGLQPNTLVMDAPVTLPPIGGVGDSWSPRNYDRGASGAITLRRALEHSKNLVTARLLDGGIAEEGPKSLDAVCALALEAQLYAACERYYPFVLGAQPVRMIDLAAFYAAVATEGARPQPYALESVEEGHRVLFRHEAKPPVAIGSADKVAFYQLRTMLQGVVARGTAASLARYSAYLGGKTGTTENENDAWFVGFTNDATIAVWVGYDNADGLKRTLGRGQTGGKTSLPIFDAILQAAWANGVPKVALGPPSPEARRQIADLAIDPRSGTRVQGGGFVEHFRMSGGQVADTQYKLVPRETRYAGTGDGDGDEMGSPDPMDPWGQPQPRRRVDPRADPWGEGDDPGGQLRSPYGQARPYNPYVSPNGGPEGSPSRGRSRAAEVPWWDSQPIPRRRDPDYFWNNGTD